MVRHLIRTEKAPCCEAARGPVNPANFPTSVSRKLNWFNKTYSTYYSFKSNHILFYFISKQ
jgi:hypothetical protein